MDQHDLFAKIMGLFHEVDNAFRTIKENYPAAVRCKAGCDNCCHACFTVSLAEALLLKKALGTQSESQRQALKIRAQHARVEFRKLENEVQTSTEDTSTLMSRWRLRCPFLLADKSCEVYPVRPVTCRAYGLPTSIGEKGHVCGFSGFDTGIDYPTIKLDKLHNYLFNLSERAVPVFELNQVLADRRYFIHDIVLEENL
jgi:Fe-S-cluster containining protein